MDRITLDDLVRIGEGREAEVFALDEARALRVARRPALGDPLRREHAAIAAAAAAGAPVPGVGELVEVDGRVAFVLDRLDERNLLLEVGDRPWRVFAIADVLGAVHAAIHAVAAPPDLPRVHDLVRERLSSPLVPPGLRDRALRRLDELADGDRLCHGDFQPGNVLLGPHGRRVVDLTAASRGDPMADVAQSQLIVRFGALGPDATAAIAALARVGRGLLWGGYLRAYARRRPLDRPAIAAWLPVLAAARLAEDIDGERPKLLELAAALPG